VTVAGAVIEVLVEAAVMPEVVEAVEPVVAEIEAVVVVAAVGGA